MLKIASFLLIPFSGLFITKLPLSPVYITFILSFYISILFLFISKKLNINSLAIFVIFYLFYVTLTQFLLGGDLNTVILIIFSLVTCLLALYIIPKLHSKYILKNSDIFINFSIFYLALESIWRLTHPVFYFNIDDPTQEKNLFYVYKISSFMYQDSNFVGIFIVSLYFFALYMSKFTSKNYIWQRIGLLILAVATISRASIISIIFFQILFYSYYKIKNKLLYSITIIFFLVISVVVFEIFLSKDDSYESKFMIINLAIDYLEHHGYIHLLFGVGFGNAKYTIGIGSHNILVTYILESGLIGFLFVSYLWFMFAKKSNYMTIIIVLPFLMNGMSLAGHAIPYLYVIFTIILILERRKIGDFNQKTSHISVNSNI